MIKIPVFNIEKIGIDLLKPYDKNAKVHSKEQIRKLTISIQEFGFRFPVLINNLHEKEIIAGHGRVLAGKELGMTEVPCVTAEDLTKEQVKLLRIADNKLTESEWDFNLLSEEFKELEGLNADLDLTGFGFDEIAGIMKDGRGEGQEDDFVVPELPQNTHNVQRGDIYQLGRHFLKCGDCCNKEDVDSLLKEIQVDAIITDPPYGVNYAGKNEYLNKLDNGNRIQESYANDEIEQDYNKFFNDFLSLGIIHLKEFNTIYICMGSTKLWELLNSFKSLEIKMHMILVWVKNNHVLSRCDYQPKHEFIIYGWKGKHKFYGNCPMSVFEYDKPLVNDLHPTMKPIELMAKIVTDGTPAKGIVYEPFCGSGSTLIACEQTGRTCYSMEILPHYVSVILERWQKLTSQKAIKCE